MWSGQLGAEEAAWLDGEVGPDAHQPPTELHHAAERVQARPVPTCRRCLTTARRLVIELGPRQLGRVKSYSIR